MVETIAPDQVAAAGANPDLVLTTYAKGSFVAVVYNLDPARAAPFDDVRARQALLMALDREAIVADVLDGLGTVARGTQPPTSPAYAPDEVAPDLPFDPERARRLLAEAGWADGDGDGVVERDGHRFAFELVYPADDGAAPLLAYLQQAWREVGVEMTPEPVAIPALTDQLLGRHAFDAALITIVLPPDGDQTGLFACDQYPHGFNLGRYCSAEHDAAADRMVREFDPARRRALQVELSTIAWRDQPVGVLFFDAATTAARAEVRNLHPTFVAPFWSLPWVWLEA